MIPELGPETHTGLHAGHVADIIKCAKGLGATGTPKMAFSIYNVHPLTTVSALQCCIVKLLHCINKLSSIVLDKSKATTDLFIEKSSETCFTTI